MYHIILHVLDYGCAQKKIQKVRVNNYITNRRRHNFILSMSRSLQENFDGKYSYKPTKYWPSYDIKCQSDSETLILYQTILI